MTTLVIAMNGRLIVALPEKREAVSKGIILTSPPEEGRIIECEVMVKGNSATLHEGDYVIIDKYVGHPYKIEDRDCLIVKEEDVLGKVFRTKHAEIAP